MFVEDLPRGEGMLFAYNSPQPVAFWMRNTLIPLDMIFLSPEGVVTRVHERAVPGDETPIPGGDEVQFVLEINGGLARALGIAEGSEARHPAHRRGRRLALRRRLRPPRRIRSRAAAAFGRARWEGEAHAVFLARAPRVKEQLGPGRGAAW